MTKLRLSSRAIFFAGLAMFMLLTGSANARYISSRDQLNAMLLPGASQEAFEAYKGANGSSLGITSLDSTTVVNGQGPGLVVPRVTFSAPSGLVWFGGTDETLGWSGTSITLTFTQPVQAMGLQIAALSYIPQSSQYHDFTIQVYGADGVTQMDSGINRTQDTAGIFQGYELDGGIGKVVINKAYSTDPYPFSLNNLTFGVVPEPSTWLVLVCGFSALTTWKVSRRSVPPKVAAA